ncbi:MAG: amino acid adenylation domain-containing protein [Bacteroidota bacterium]
MLVFHPAVVDHGAVDLLLQELTNHQAAWPEQVKDLAPSKPFARFAQWQESLPDKARDQMAYFWRSQLQSYTHQSFFQTPARPYSDQPYGQAIRSLSSVAPALNELATQQGNLPKELLELIALQLLRKYSGREDVALITPVTYREVKGLAPLIGPLANRMVLRSQSSDTVTFKQYANEMARVKAQALKFKDLPLETWTETLGMEMPEGWADLTFQYASDASTQNMVYQSEGGFSTPLALTIRETEDGLQAQLDYDARVCPSSFAEAWLGAFASYVEACVQHADQPLYQIPYLPEAAEGGDLSAIQSTGAYLHTADTIHGLFEAQVAQRPEQIAIVSGEVRLTYAALNEQAHALAAHLQQAYDIQPDQRVGLMLHRSEHMIISIMAVLKAGGAYVPIDPTYPQERIDYILEDAGVTVLLTDQETAQVPKSVTCVRVDEPLPTTGDSPLVARAEPHHVAYVIYTSGTTGQPKGVLVEHRNVVQLLFPEEPLFDFGPEDRWTVFHSYSFDFSVWEMFGPLLTGGRAVIVPGPTARDGYSFMQLLSEEGITVLNQTPSAFKNIQAILQDDPSVQLAVRYVIFGGEALQAAQLVYWNQRFPATRLINMYGITETTVHNTYHEVSTADIEADLNNIGKPLPTLSAWVLDGYGQLVPPGGVGELYVGGTGVTRGYLNRPELTEARFVTLPWLPEQRLYRTGDLVQVHLQEALHGGSMHYRGRIDKQVKIRGYRIELAEIEKTLLAHTAVESAVVIAREDVRGEQALFAYVRGTADEASLKDYLAQQLPEYMVPGYLSQIAEFPLTTNGKIDVKALPDLSAEDTASTAVAPQTPLQAQVLSVWKSLIDREHLGIHDHFFEMGGHSLSAVQLSAKLYKLTGTRLSLEDIFAKPTIAEQAELLEKASSAPYSPIARCAEQAEYPLSSAQQRLYVLHQFNENSLAYNMPAMFEVNGSLDLDRLEATFRQLIDRHEILRTSFHSRQGQPYQRIHTSVDFAVEHLTLEEDLDATLQAFMRPFLLDSPALFRVGVLPLVNGNQGLLWDIHHIITDGQSMELLVKDFLALYRGDSLPELSLQYRDFATWQREDTEHRTRLEAQKAFWVDQFAEPLDVLELPTDFTRPTYKDDAGKTYPFAFSQADSEALKQLAAEAGVTPFMLFLTLYLVTLYRLTQQNDIVIGVPTAGRTHPDVETVVGMFANTLPLRNELEGDTSFAALLQQVRVTTLAAFQHQDFQYEELLEELSLGREVSRNPLFDVMLVMQDQPQEKLTIPGLALTPVAFEEGVSKFDLSLYCKEDDGHYALYWEYRTDLFTEDTVAKFAHYFHTLTRSVLQDANQPVRALEILTEAERQALLTLSNAHPVSFPSVSLVDLLQEQVAQRPDALALVSDTEQLTYRELDERTNRLANYLIHQHQVQKEELVGLLFERSERMVITLLAVLKAGAAYVPLAPDIPDDRKRFILEDAGLRLFLTEGTPSVDTTGLTVVDLVQEASDIAGQSTQYPALAIVPEQLAYVIYTSGTTGNPKGVLVEHRNVVQLLFPDTPLFDFGPEDTWSLFHSYSFDVSVWEIFGCLLNGGKLVVVPFATAQDGLAFAELLEREHVTVLCQTPSAFKNLQTAIRAQENPSEFTVRYVIFAGEALQSATLRYWKGRYPHCQMINMYGITETTVHNTYKELSAAEITAGEDSIGRMLPTLTAFVLDQNRELVPVGVTGELYVGGAGVTRGYLNRPELNAERFIADPFGVHARLYKSGDLVQLQADGSMLYMGRADKQVKIRGYRIELAEVEQSLEAHLQIKSTVVVAKEDRQGVKFLVAYIVSEANLNATDIRNFLLERLPSYMVPGYYLFMESWPLTKNGKINVRALPGVESLTGESEYVAPGTALEQEIANAWQLLLNREQISVTDNFFELGGHSLSATQLTAWLHKITGVRLELRDVFIHATIAEQAALIRSSEQAKYTPIASAPAKEYYPLSSAQKRLFVLYSLDPTLLAYNMPAVMKLEGEVTAEKLEATFLSLVQRHESLRTAFVLQDGEPVQQIREVTSFSLTHFPKDTEAEVGMLRLVKPFDLESGLLIRAGLIPAEDHYLLLIDMHHIVADGLSVNLLVEDFLALYQAQTLSPLSLHYKDYAVWQNTDAGQQALNAQQRAFWLDAFADPVEALSLPTPKARPIVSVGG